MTEKQEDISESTEDNAIHTSTQVSVCNICGENHETENCVVLQDLKPVHDTKTISRARLTTPENLEVRTLADGSTTVVAKVTFERGTQFGPFQAQLTIDMHPAITFPLKVFGKNAGEGYYLDSTDEETCNWMCLVAPATSSKEQNLVCYDVKQNIYYTAIRDIVQGEELRVWYALYYGLKLQALPLADDSDTENGFWDLADDDMERKLKAKNSASMILGTELMETLAQHLPAHTLGAKGERDFWNCRLCGNQETNVASYARHLMAHYRRRVNSVCRSQCQICSKCFYNAKALEKHKENQHQECFNSSEPISTDGCTANQENEFAEILDSETLTGDESQKFDLMSSLKERSKSLEEFRQNSLEDVVSEEKFDQSRKLMSLAHISSAELQNLDNVSTSNETTAIYVEERQAEINMTLGSTQTWNAEIDLQANSLAVQNQKLLDCSTRTEINIFPANVHECNSPTRNEHGSQNKEENPLTSSESVLNVDANTNELVESPARLQNQASPDVDVFTIDSNSHLFLQSDDASTVEAAINSCEKQEISVALENGEPVTLILVSPSTEDMSNPHKPNEKEKTVDETVQYSETCERNSHTNSKETDASISAPDEKSYSTFNCDICNKSFEKSSYLYRHLRKHTGEFTCMSCLAVFARKENLQSHSCARPMVRYPCSICGKKFSAKKYLQRHIPLHTGEFTCQECNRPFVSRMSLAAHRCLKNDSTSNKNNISCYLCHRVFSTQTKLQSHLKLHTDVNSRPEKGSSPLILRKSRLLLKKFHQPPKPKLKTEKGPTAQREFVCEVCGATFKGSSSMKAHMLLHGERRFECEICKKRFHRKDILQDHLTVHQDAKLPCLICGKKYKTKKSLDVHLLIHNGSKRFACGECGREFFQKGNLLKHQETHTTERLYPCQYCSKTFTSKDYFNVHVLEHTQGKIFCCDICGKSFVKKHFLESHRRLYHSNRAFLCRFCNSVLRHRHSVCRHLEMRHDDHRQEWTTPGFIDSMLAELPESVLSSGTGAVEGPLTPSQRQQRQETLLALRRKHFGDGTTVIDAEATIIEDLDSTSDYLYTVVPLADSESQVVPLHEGDPNLMLQPAQQYTFLDNCLVATASVSQDQFPVSASSNPQALMVASDVQGAEILLTVIGPNTDSNVDSINSSMLPTESDTLNINEGETYLMEEDPENNGVLFYVVETTDGDVTETQDLLWNNGTL